MFIILVLFFLIPSPIFAQSNNPFGQSGSWIQIFSDEFSSNTLDLQKWRPNWLGSSDTSITPPINSTETACYHPSQFSLSNGELRLIATTNTNSLCKNRLGEVAKYASGIIQSNGKFNFTYGYIESKIWNPSGSGVWPAFWTDGQNWPTDGEIDIMECYGSDASCSYHYHYSGGGPGGNFTVIGSTSGWHIYAANWEPGKITWYYDGQPVWQNTTGIISAPHYLILNLGLKSSTPPIPSIMKVDYVRVWQKNTASPTFTTIIGDANHDSRVDLIDFTAWKNEYLGNTTSMTADFNHDSFVNLLDFSLWKSAYL